MSLVMDTSSRKKVKIGCATNPGGASLSTAFYCDDLGVPARRALIQALVVARFSGLNEAEPQRLLALGAWPKGKGLRRGIPKRFWHTPNLEEILCRTCDGLFPIN
jgi:hypothetical protein